MNYGLAYRIGFHPWEDAEEQPSFIDKFSALLDREERGRQPPYGSALDVGTGSGIWGIKLARRGWQVTGVDIVGTALRRAHERIREAGVDMRLVQGDVTELRATNVGTGFRLVLDTGTFHGLTAAEREAMGREVGEERWSILALPFIVIGSTLFAFLPAMEIAMLAAADAGADIQMVLIALDSWFFPILLAGAITFAVGVLDFAMGIALSGVLSRRLTSLVVGALVVMAAARFVPLGVALYAGGVATTAALWPLAYEMWKHPEAARLAEQPRPRLAT